MNYKNLLIFFVLFSSLKAFSDNTIDSLGVENLNGKKVILHKVEAKESYYSIGRKYKVTPQTIMDFNNGKTLQPAETIKIPTQINFTEKPVSFASGNLKSKETIHKVIAKETLYSIASKYNMRVDDLKLLNGITTSNLTIGQTLKVLVSDEVSLNQKVETNTAGKPVLVEKKQKPEPKPPVQEVNKIKYIDSTDSNGNMEIPRNRYGITEMNDKGLAVWIDDDNLDASKSYALHRTAPVGTIVKITNPMTDRSVFAKVVGRFTENQTTKDVIIVLTKATSDAIGALDKRFLVHITFGIPNEQ